MGTILEIASKKAKGGRRYIKMALLTIHEAERETNLNGIHWKEEYILKNIETAQNMPICCEFTDESKTIPLGHGFTEQIVDENDNPLPVFTDSEVVGTIEKAQIETLNINGEDKKVLVGEGYLYNQRYPNFVKWLKNSMADGEVKSSVEIVGTEDNNNVIVYEGESTKDYRIPMEFSFSGTAILSVKEADENAIVLEAASLNKSNDNKRESEDETMDEKTINLICDSVKNAVSETNSKNSEYETKIAELNASIAEKDNQISELNASIAEKDNQISELNAEKEKWVSEKTDYEKALGEAKAKEKLAELNSAIEGFTEEQRAFAKDEIEAFKADPMNSEINSITDKIYREIGKTALENAKVVETNSVDDTTDIFGEINSTNANTDGEDIDIFATVL